MYKKLGASLMAALLIALLSANDVQAWYRFRNGTSQTVWVSFQWYSPGCGDFGSEWIVQGWYLLEPGQTKTVFGADLQSTGSRYYYWYAERSDGAAWSGPFETCAPLSAFTWCDDVCDREPGTRTYGYREKYIGSANNYTTTLRD